MSRTAVRVAGTSRRGVEGRGGRSGVSANVETASSPHKLPTYASRPRGCTAAALAAGCDDNGQKFSRSEVERAFRSQGLKLLAPTAEDRLLAPKNTDEQFVVFIFPNEGR